MSATLVYCPECDGARAVDEDRYDVMVAEREKPVATLTLRRCAGCGASVDE